MILIKILTLHATGEHCPIETKREGALVTKNSQMQLAPAYIPEQLSHKST